MLRKLITKPLSLSSRTPELKKYLCIRESLLPSIQASSIQSFKSLQSKYNLSSADLMSLISLLRLNPCAYQKYLTYSEFSEKSEQWLREYRLNKFFDVQVPLETRQKTLSEQYPEVLTYMNGSSEREKMLKELEPVFFDAGTRENSVKGFTYKKIHEKIKAHIQNLKEKGQYSIELEFATNEILESLKNDYKGKLIDMKVFFDSFGQTCAKSKDLTVKEVKKPLQSIDSDKNWTSRGLKVMDLQELDNLENVEFKRFLEENNKEVIDEHHSVALAEWVNDRKLVFESEKIDFTAASKQGAWLAIFGYVALGGFLYVIYKGDARFITLLVLPVVGVLSLKYGGRKLNAARISYLQRLWIHKDGKHMDLELANFRGAKLHKDVAIKDFKVFKEGKSPVNLAKSAGNKGKNLSTTLEKLRVENQLMIPSIYFEAGETAGMIPTGSQNQRFAWENILKGVEFDTKQA